MSRGFFTIAQGEQYQRLAYALALSLKISQKESGRLSIGVTADEIDKIPAKYRAVFDEVIEIPGPDAAKDSAWKLENEWKVIEMTPYDETIKLDADMFFPEDISSWWEYFQHLDAYFVSKPVTYRGDVITSDYYRKTFTESGLPNAYTAFFYFKKNPKTHELFDLAKQIFENWEQFFYEYLAPENRPTFVSTDVVFALASKLLDYIGMHGIHVPTFVHMKTKLQGWPEKYENEDWTQLIPTYFNTSCQLRIGNYLQNRPIHYHVKEFMTDRMIEKMERKLGL
jgi:hypothetical protein